MLSDDRLLDLQRELVPFLDSSLAPFARAIEAEARREALEEAAKRVEPKNHPDDWTEDAAIAARHAAAIRALKEQG